MPEPVIPASNIPEDIRKKISEDANMHDPVLRRLEMLQVLAQDPKNDLTELSFDESIDFALIEAIHRMKVLKLDGVIQFFEILKQNRVSLDRKRVNEYLKGIIGQVNGQLQPVQYYGSPGTVEPEKKSILDRMMFWKKD
jgi:hypothetical protein